MIAAWFHPKPCKPGAPRHKTMLFRESEIDILRSDIRSRDRAELKMSEVNLRNLGNLSNLRARTPRRRGRLAGGRGPPEKVITSFLRM